MAKDKNKENNFLDYIPVRVDKYGWEADENGEVNILVENTGVFNRIAQKLLKKPRITKVHLQGIGSFVWPLMDGKRSIYDIGELVKEHYGEEAQPLYPRLVEYTRLLKACGFIEYKK